MTTKLYRITLATCAMLLSLSVSANDKMDIKAGFAFDMGFGVTALINDQFNIMIGNDGIAGDYLFRKGAFNADIPFTWYVAGGGYAEWNEGFGVRLPLGLNLNFERNWNAYAQIAPDIDFDDNNDVKFGAQLGIGLRYSF
ncbi:MAG: hypothetical protein OQK77_03525 [Psychromonas sp.]|nr:hypothetical protein [Psychromonas sp.]